MKIKSYKGSSLEKLHSIILDELGPQAVVICKDSPRGIGGFLKKPGYELVAVVEDNDGDAHLVTRAAERALSDRMTLIQDDSMRRIEEMLNKWREDSGGGNSMVLPVAARCDDKVPVFASEWDQRFVRTLVADASDIFDDSKNNILRQKMSELICCEEIMFRRAERGQPGVFVLAGPTGSGKTTTMAKLAAKCCMENGLKVGLITMDTYRVAAIDQTKEYALLLGLDLKVVFSATETARAMQSFADKDVVFVDTPGRNYRDPVSMSNLRGMLQGLGSYKVLLVVPATVSNRSGSEIVAKFGVLGQGYLVVSKLDEALNPAVFTALACDAGYATAFVTNGQRVPQDIRPARTGEIVEMLMDLPGDGKVEYKTHEYQLV